MHRHVLLLVASAILDRSNAGNIFTSSQQLGTNSYDFVIVGGGTAGPVLANRLSTHPNVSVLLVEAGSSHHDFFDARVPYLAPELAMTAADWNYTTVPQTGYDNRTVPYNRGHVLGGSSTVNYMAYNRASNDTYDRWAEILQDERWSWKNLESYYRRNSRLVPPADGRDYYEDVIASAHGYGPVDVSVAAEPYELDYRVIEASKSLGGRFAFNQDLNAGKFVGISWSQSSIGDGQRSSAATAYLDPLFEEPIKSTRKMDVLLNTQVTRLIQTPPTSNSSGLPAFRMAEMVSTSANTTFQISARKEIILSAGVVGSPQILLQSGIGPAHELSALNITPIVDLPSVGKNLTDHPLTPLHFTVEKNTSVDAIMQNSTIMDEALEQWNTSQTGPLANTASNTYGFLRLPSSSPAFNESGNPAAGPHASNIELLFSEGFVPLSSIPMPETGYYLTVLTVVTSPTSRGSITLDPNASDDLLAHPIIDPNYLSTDFDQYAAVQAIKDTFEFLSHPAFEGYIGEAYGPLANRTTDAELLEYVKKYAGTIYHSVGTAKMAPRGEEGWGVVDPDLKVKGMEGVRVVDASVFPEIPECHTMVPVYIVAERAAGFIQDEYELECGLEEER